MSHEKLKKRNADLQALGNSAGRLVLVLRMSQRGVLFDCRRARRLVLAPGCHDFDGRLG